MFKVNDEVIMTARNGREFPARDIGFRYRGKVSVVYRVNDWTHYIISVPPGQIRKVG